MANTDFTESPIVWVILVLVFAGIFGTIGFLILGSLGEVVEETGVVEQTSTCSVDNVTNITESEEDPDCGLVGSDYLSLVTFIDYSIYNCTADPWALFERTEDNCTCGCDDALYRIKVSWWEYEEIEEDWEDPCYVDASYQWFGPPNETYTCDCGCDSDDEIWIYPVGVYDVNFTDPNPENWTWEYNYTICYAEDYLGIMMDYYFDEENNTYVVTTACNVSQFYNVSEPCEYQNVTDDYWNLSKLCTESGDCGCVEGDEWFGTWSYEWNVTYCTNWNVTNCSCDGDLVTDTVCADSEYTWSEYDYDDPCEEVYNLTILTACNGLDEEWEWIEEVYCYNETNFDPEWPPWNYTDDVWFASECDEVNTTVVSYDDYECDPGPDEGDCEFTATESTTWTHSYTDVVGGVQTGFGMYGLIPLMVIVSVVISLLISAFAIRKSNE